MDWCRAVLLLKILISLAKATSDVAGFRECEEVDLLSDLEVEERLSCLDQSKFRVVLSTLGTLIFHF